MWAWEHLAAGRSWHYDHKKQHFDPVPYLRTGPGLALDGKLKVDLRKAEVRSDLFRTAAPSRPGGRGAGNLRLFQGVASTGPRTWPGHVFNKANNINGIDGNGTNTQTLKVPAILEIQKAYVRKVIDTVNDLDNVLYEVANEAYAGSAEWQYEIIRYIKGYEAGKPKQHLLGMTCRSDEPDNEVLFRSPADWVSPGTYKTYAHDPPAAGGRMVSLLDTDHIFGVGGDRKWIWKAFTRGHNPIYMDPLWGYIPDKELWKGQAERGQGARQAMGDTRRYAERINLAAMTPQEVLSPTKYCLADPGEEYLIYQPKKEEFAVKLPEGKYAVEWFDPESSKAVRADSVTGGDEQRFTPPFRGDAVLYLTRITQ